MVQLRCTLACHVNQTCMCGLFLLLSQQPLMNAWACSPWHVVICFCHVRCLCSMLVTPGITSSVWLAYFICRVVSVCLPFPSVCFLRVFVCFLGRLLRVDLIKCVSNVRPSTKSFFDFNEIWCLGRGQRVMHDGMQYDPIQGQGHEPFKVGNSAIFNSYLLPHL